MRPGRMTTRKIQGERLTHRSLVVTGATLCPTVWGSVVGLRNRPRQFSLFDLLFTIYDNRPYAGYARPELSPGAVAASAVCAY